MKKNLSQTLVAGLIAILMVGCASKGLGAGTNSQNPAAKIYVLRHFSVGKGGPIKISANGTSVGTIHRGGILQWTSKPGKITIVAAGADEAKIDVDARANETYYVEVKATRDEDRSRGVALRLLSAREGSRLLETLQKKDNPFRGLQ
jgi:hypothetical protein